MLSNQQPPVRAFWSPTPPPHVVTSVAVCPKAALLYTGSTDGAIVRWQLDTATPPSACVMLVGHNRAIQHLAPGLTVKDTGGHDGGGADCEGAPRRPFHGGGGGGGQLLSSRSSCYLLSVDEAGGCCLWLEPAGRCVMQRVVPELTRAMFAEMPPPDQPSLAGAGRLLAVLPPAASLYAPASPPGPPGETRQSPGIPTGKAGAGPGPGPGGGNDGSGAPAGSDRGPRCPVALVLDWRSLCVTQLLPMAPLQQLVDLDLPPNGASYGRTAAGAGADPGDATAVGPRGQPYGRPGYQAYQRVIRRGWRMASPDPDPDPDLDPGAEHGAADNGLHATDDLLSVRVSSTQVVPLGAPDGGSSGCHGSLDGGGGGGATACSATTLVVAAAVTADGTMYGCIVPYDPYRPPGWSLEGCGPGGAAGGPAEAAAAPLPEVAGPLLAAALSEDLGWAVLGSIDSWIVMEAGREATWAKGGGPPPYVLRLSYSATCRINLMNQQPGRGWPRPAAGSTVPPASWQQQQQRQQRPWLDLNDEGCLITSSDDSDRDAALKLDADLDPDLDPEAVVCSRGVGTAGGRATVGIQARHPAIRASTRMQLIGSWDGGRREGAVQSPAVAVRVPPSSQQRSTNAADGAAAAASADGGGGGLPRQLGTDTARGLEGTTHAPGGATEPDRLAAAADPDVAAPAAALDSELVNSALGRLSFAVYLSMPTSSETGTSTTTAAPAARADGGARDGGGGDSTAPAPSQPAAATPQLPPAPAPADAGRAELPDGRAATGSLVLFPPLQHQSSGDRGAPPAPSQQQQPQPRQQPQQSSQSYDQSRTVADCGACRGPPSCRASPGVRLELLCWSDSGNGRPQVVTLTPRGRIVAVQELPAAAAAAPPRGPTAGRDRQPGQEQNEGGAGPSAGSHGGEGGEDSRWSFCCHVPAGAGLTIGSGDVEGGGGGGGEGEGAGDGGARCSGAGDGGAGGAGAGWVIGVRCYRMPPTHGPLGSWSGCPSTAVLQWPLRRQRQRQRRREPPPWDRLAGGEAAAAAPDGLPTGPREPGGTQATALAPALASPPLVAHLSAGWGGAVGGPPLLASGVWPDLALYGTGQRARGTKPFRALADHRAVGRRSDSGHSTGSSGSGSCSSRYGDDTSICGGSGSTSGDGELDGEVSDCAAGSPLRRRGARGRGVNRPYGTYDNGADVKRCGWWWWLDEQRDGEWGACGSTSPAHWVYGTRRGCQRRLLDEGLLTCLSDRWGAVHIGGGGGASGDGCRTDPALHPVGSISSLEGGTEGEGVRGRRDEAATLMLAAARVTSTSVVLCGGGAAAAAGEDAAAAAVLDEAVILHCMADGSMRFCHAGAYGVPPPPLPPPQRRRRLHNCTTDWRTAAARRARAAPAPATTADGPPAPQDRNTTPTGTPLAAEVAVAPAGPAPFAAIASPAVLGTDGRTADGSGARACPPAAPAAQKGPTMTAACGSHGNRIGDGRERAAAEVGAGAEGEGAAEESAVRQEPMELRPLLAGRMMGHMGPVTCQVEVVYQPAVASGPASPPALPLPAPHHRDAARPSTPQGLQSMLSDPYPYPTCASQHHQQRWPASPGGVDSAAASAADGGGGSTGGGGGPVRLLLTGAADGSLRGWDTHRSAFGRVLFALHPHGGAVRRLLLPRGEAHAPAEFRHCVVSAAEDGSVALVCVERGSVVRVCRAYPYGMPEVVSWSFRRGFLACGGHDRLGRWAVAVYDLAPAVPSLDRITIGPEARTILADGPAAEPLVTPPPPYGPPAAGAAATAAAATHTQRSMQYSHWVVQQQQQQQQQQVQAAGRGVPKLISDARRGSGGGGTMPYTAATAAAVSAADQQYQHSARVQGQGRVSYGSVPLYGQMLSAAAQASSSIPAAAAVMSASVSSPRLAPAWAYGGSFRTMYCGRPDVVLAAIDGESLLTSLAAAEAAAAADMVSIGSRALSAPVPVPSRAGSRGGGGGAAAAGVSPGHHSTCLSTPGVLSPAAASPSLPGRSPYGSRSASFDMPPVAAAAATAAASVAGTADAAAASPRGAAAAAAARPSAPFRSGGTAGLAGGVSGDSNGTTGGNARVRWDSHGGGSGGDGASGGGGGSGRPSLDDTAAAAGRRSRRSSVCNDWGLPGAGGRAEGAGHCRQGEGGVGEAAVGGDDGGCGGVGALASMLSVLHTWACDPRVDCALEAALLELGILTQGAANTAGAGAASIAVGMAAGGGGGGSGDDGVAGRKVRVSGGGGGSGGAVVAGGGAAALVEGAEATQPLRSRSVPSLPPPPPLAGSTVRAPPLRAATSEPCACGTPYDGGSCTCSTPVPAPSMAPSSIAPFDDGEFAVAAGDAATASSGAPPSEAGERGGCGGVEGRAGVGAGGGARGGGGAGRGGGAWRRNGSRCGSLVQPAYVSPCGSVAIALPQLTRPHPIDPRVGDPTSTASLLLHLVTLAVAFSGLTSAASAAAAGGPGLAVRRTAALAASRLRRLYLATAPEEVAAALRKSQPRPAPSPGGDGAATRETAPAPELVREADLAVFARHWMAADPWVREAAHLLLCAYTVYPAPPTATTAAASRRTEAGSADAAGTAAAEASSYTPPPLPLLPDQVTELLHLRSDTTGAGSPSRSGPVPQQPQRSRRTSRELAHVAPPPPPPPQRLYPAVVVAAAACLYHPDAVPRALLAATSTSLTELLCLPLTVGRAASYDSGTEAFAGGGGGAAAASSASPISGRLPTQQQQHSHFHAHAHQQEPQPPLQPQQPQQASGGLWGEGGVLLPAVAAAILTAVLKSPQAGRWRREMRPWERFIDRLVALVHAIPLPPAGPSALPYDAAPGPPDLTSPPTMPSSLPPTIPSSSSAAAAAATPSAFARRHPLASSSSPSGKNGTAAGTTAEVAAAAATGGGANSAPQRAARQLAEQVVSLLAAVMALDVRAVLDGLGRYAGGFSLPLHPLVGSALRLLASSLPGRCRLARAVPSLARHLAAAVAAPAARGRPDLQRPAYFAAADLAAVVPCCVALHAQSMQLAAASPLASSPTRSSSAATGAANTGEPQFVTVYDMEHGTASWQLPLQPGPDALHPLPPGAAAVGAAAGPGPGGCPGLQLVAGSRTTEGGGAAAGGGAAGTTAIVNGIAGGGGGGGLAPPSPPPPTAVAAAANGGAAGGGGAASEVMEVLCGLARGGVAALQFSPAGDQLAVLVVDGASVPALLVYGLQLPWSYKLLTLQGVSRQPLVVQPCHCWLLPGLGACAGRPPQPRPQQQSQQWVQPQRPQWGELQPKRQEEQEVGQREQQRHEVGRQHQGKREQRRGDGAAGVAARAVEGDAAAVASGDVEGCGKGGMAAWTRWDVGVVKEAAEEDGDGEGPLTAAQEAMLAQVVGRPFGLRWSGQSCVELLYNRAVVLARFVLPGSGG